MSEEESTFLFMFYGPEKAYSNGEHAAWLADKLTSPHLNKSLLCLAE